MKSMEVEGLDELIRKTEAMGKNPTGLVKRALYVGAGVMADAIKSAVASLPVDDMGTKKSPMSGVTAVEKEGLVSGIGISRMKAGAEKVEVVIGFAGTNADGVKNTTTMRRVESGTSIRRKKPTIRPTANRTKMQAMDAMQDQFSKDLQDAYK